MKIVYQANNGRVFETEAEAIHQDRFIEEVNDILRPFRGESISSGQFIQRNSQQINSLISKTHNLLSRYHGPDSEIANSWQKDPRGFVGRYLDDANSPAYSIYGVLLSIDNNNRQWNQPYYALAANRGEYPR